MDPNELRPNPKNPNTHRAEQVEKLGEVIAKAGWRQPITVSQRSGLVIKGHGRLLAALSYALSPVPVEYQEYADEAEEIADMIADNKLAELSIMDSAKLRKVLEELESMGGDLALAGFDVSVLEVESEIDVREVTERLELAAEFKPMAIDKIEKITTQVSEALERLAEEAPERLAKALCVVVPTGRGDHRDCVIIADPKLGDIVAELRRYADDGIESPCAALLDGLVRYAPLTEVSE